LHHETAETTPLQAHYATLSPDSRGITSLLDEAERPHIPYRNGALTELMYTYLPGPPELNLSAAILSSTLVLTWNPILEVSEYWVHGTSNYPWYSPGFGPDYQYRLSIELPPTTSWSSSAGAGDPSANWTYLVMAVDETEVELARSNRAGEVDCLNDIP
jgi:hypothetical protein